MSGVPKSAPKFTALLEGFTELSIESYSPEWFITARVYKEKIYQQKLDKKGEVWEPGRNQMQTCKSPWPVVIQDALNYSSNHLWWQMWNAHQRSSFETQCLRFSWGTGHVATLCLIYTKIPDTQKESRCLVQTMLFVQQSKHNEPSFYEWWRPSWNQSFQKPSKVQPCTQFFLRIATSSLQC